MVVFGVCVTYVRHVQGRSVAGLGQDDRGKSTHGVLGRFPALNFWQKLGKKHIDDRGLKSQV